MVQENNAPKKIINLNTNIYVILVLSIFPLVYRNYYYDILQTKYYFYCIISITYVVISIICVIVVSIKNKGFYFKNVCLKSTNNIPNICMLLFILIATISTLTSDYKFESFWGNEGRYTGLFLFLIYAAVFYLVSSFLKLNQKYIDLFLTISILICMFGITDYFQMDILGFKKDMAEQQKQMFASTLGNINTYTAFISISLGISTVLFAKEKRMFKRIWYFINIFISFMAIIMGCSDNAYLSLVALFGILPLFLFDKKQGLVRYTIIIASFFSIIQIIDWINISFGESVIGLDSLFNIISGFSFFPFVAILLWIFVAFLLYSKKWNSREEIGSWLRFTWLGLILIITLLVFYAVYDININQNIDKYGKLSSYLYFNDSWGTSRGFVWRLSIEEYLKFSPVHKLFGYGPDTFGILMVHNYKKEMLEFTGGIFDNAHNEYLHLLMTVGPLALLSYIVLFLSSGYQMIKNGIQNPSVLALFMAILCYSSQALVNINLPIVAPIVMTMLAMGLAGVRKGNQTKLT